MSHICFFSSDSRPLYKSDVFNALCLPDNYVIQFRYREKYIQSNLLSDLKGLIGKFGVIFFAKSHNEEQGELQGQTINYPIRGVKIQDFDYSIDTGQVLFYLELLDFKEYIIDPLTDVSLLPPTLFVSELNLNIKTDRHDWLNRITAIKPYFKNHLFAKIKLIDKKANHLVVPQYQKIEKETIYELNDESEYVLDLTFAHTEDIKAKNQTVSSLQIVDKTDQTIINCPSTITIGTNYDNRKYRLLTKSLSINKTDGFINFSMGEVDKEENETMNVVQEFSITLRIVKGWFSMAIFGVMSAIVALAIAFLAILLKQETINYLYVIACAIAVFLSTSYLYWRYNKK